VESRLTFEHFLLIAEAVLRLPYDELERAVCVFRAQSALAAPFARVQGTFLYPDPIDQAAICARQLIRSRPLPFGNKQVGYECMREMLLLSGLVWSRPEEDAEEVAETLKGVQAGTIGEAEFLTWVRSRVTA
jgi:prophage maintenance system killer protein